jgi:hypothetical protein
MSQPATIRYSEAGDEYTFEAPDSDIYFTEPVPEEGMIVLKDTDTGKIFLVVFSNYTDGDLQPNQVYELQAVDTEVETEDEEAEEEDEEDEDGDEEDEDEEETVGNVQNGTH